MTSVNASIDGAVIDPPSTLQSIGVPFARSTPFPTSASAPPAPAIASFQAVGRTGTAWTDRPDGHQEERSKALLPHTSTSRSICCPGDGPRRWPHRLSVPGTCPNDGARIQARSTALWPALSTALSPCPATTCQEEATSTHLSTQLSAPPADPARRLSIALTALSTPSTRDSSARPESFKSVISTEKELFTYLPPGGSPDGLDGPDR